MNNRKLYNYLDGIKRVVFARFTVENNMPVKENKFSASVRFITERHFNYEARGMFNDRFAIFEGFYYENEMNDILYSLNDSAVMADVLVEEYSLDRDYTPRITYKRSGNLLGPFDWNGKEITIPISKLGDFEFNMRDLPVINIEIQKILNDTQHLQARYGNDPKTRHFRCGIFYQPLPQYA